MTIQEFEEKYYLHDSSIEKVFFDADKKILTLEIEFCFWWQPWHEKNKPSNGLIRLTFERFRSLNTTIILPTESFPTNSTVKY